MSPTVPFDLIFSFFVGLTFAACARQQFSGGAAPWGRELVAVLSFEAIIGWPVALYFCLVFPDWSWMYLVDPRRLPWGVSLLILLGQAATLMAGYLAGWALLHGRRPRALWGGLAGTAAVLVGLGIGFSGRLRSAGTFAEYHAGRAASIGSGKLGPALAATSIGVALAIVLVGRTLWEQGRRSRVS